jgi:solute carrier family 25 (mitochondrial oxoglutarate transporter), member 11
MTGATCSHPLDLIKVRMQLQGEVASVLRPSNQSATSLGMTRMAAHITSSDGVSGLFRGVTASLGRQFVYSGSRFGIYDVLKSKVSTFLGRPHNNQSLPLIAKVGTAMTAGGIGAFLANPGDVAMVRMQADGKRQVQDRRNYRNVLDAIRRIASEEGVTTLWRGSGPTVNRAMIVTVGHLAAYDEVKQRLLRSGHFKDTIPTHFVSSFSAAFVASVLSHPVDVAKTRLMNMSKAEYAGMTDCLLKTIRHEGPLALYKGFVPTLVRQMPYVIITWITIEQLKSMFNHCS